MMDKKIWIMSDLHFCHNKEFVYIPRGFKSVEEMNAALVKNINDRVKEDDDFYILGDCVLGDIDKGIELLKQLNGNKYLAFGNHDSPQKIERFKEENIFKDIQLGYRLKCGKRYYSLTHRPMLMTNFDLPMVEYNISGHTHSPNCVENFDKGVYNVAPEAQCNSPITLEQIHKEISEYKQTRPLFIFKTEELLDF